MARTLTVTAKKRYAKRRVRWSPYHNAFSIYSNMNTNQVLINASYGIAWNKIIDNSAQISTPTPTIVKVGNIRIATDVGVLSYGIFNYQPTVYCVYIPEAWADEGISQATFGQKMLQAVSLHPEWVLAQVVLPSLYFAPGESSTQTMNDITPLKTVSSRLKRNLNSGDAIYIVLIMNYKGWGGSTDQGLRSFVWNIDIRAYTCNN